MPSKIDPLELLLSKNVLWLDETRHEAMLLCKILYEKKPELRDTIIIYILDGPPRELYKNADNFEEIVEHEIFILLKHIEANGLPLNKSGNKALKKIEKKHQNWKLREHYDIAAPVISGWHENKFTVDEILTKEPIEIANLLKKYEDTIEKPRRDLCEAVGFACARDRNWCLQLFSELNKIILELPEDTIYTIFWSMPSSDKEWQEKWEVEQIQEFFLLLKSMIEKRAVGEFWKGLPKLLYGWQKNINLEIEIWFNLAISLSEIFAGFDYEGEKRELPVEWIQRAINHPFGHLTELFFDYTYKTISKIGESKHKAVIEPRILQFYQLVVKKYLKGTRYGLCLLAQQLAWFEAVFPEWTDKNLIQLFLLDTNKERFIVLWSGYLWSNSLSRRLSEVYKDTYLKAFIHFKDFAEQEQESLVRHVAGLVWFRHIKLDNLRDFISHINRKGRLLLLESWEAHLAKAVKKVAEDFWKDIIIDYWKWCGREGYLNPPEGNDERFGFWKLLIKSYNVFPHAKKLAIEMKPTEVDVIGLFTKQMSETDFASKYPQEFVELLVAFIKIDRHPEWHQEEWSRLWESVKDSCEKGVEELRDELARKNVLQV